MLVGVSSTGSLDIVVVDSTGKSSGQPEQVAANLLTLSKSPVRVKHVTAGSRRVGEFRKADKSVNRCASAAPIVYFDDLILLDSIVSVSQDKDSLIAGIYPQFYWLLAKTYLPSTSS